MEVQRPRGGGGRDTLTLRPDQHLMSSPSVSSPSLLTPRDAPMRLRRSPTGPTTSVSPSPLSPSRRAVTPTPIQHSPTARPDSASPSPVSPCRREATHRRTRRSPPSSSPCASTSPPYSCHRHPRRPRGVGREDGVLCRGVDSRGVCRPSDPDRRVGTGGDLGTDRGVEVRGVNHGPAGV